MEAVVDTQFTKTLAIEDPKVQICMFRMKFCIKILVVKMKLCEMILYTTEPITTRLTFQNKISKDIVLKF